MMQKKLAIVIINWNSFDLTSDTLVSLSSTSYKNYDIIVVDNFSTFFKSFLTLSLGKRIGFVDS